MPVASDFLQTSPFFSSPSHSLFFYCCFSIFFRLSCFLLVIIEIFLFSVFIHAKQGRKRLSRHLYQNRPMIILSPALHMFTCTQLFLQCSAAADLWRLHVRVSVSICVQMTWLCLSAYVCSFLWDMCWQGVNGDFTAFGLFNAKPLYSQGKEKKTEFTKEWISVKM